MSISINDSMYSSYLAQNTQNASASASAGAVQGAVGGINEHNVGQFLRAGMAGAGVGGMLTNRAWIAAGAYERITEAAGKLVEAVKAA